MNKIETGLIILLLIAGTFLFIECSHRDNISENKLSKITSSYKKSETQLVKKEISRHQIKKFGGITNFQRLKKSDEKEVEFKYYINKSYFR